MEGIYEYGSRAGVWRHPARVREARPAAHRVRRRAWRCSAIPNSPRAFVELGHEIACHGWRWIHYQNVDEATEREHMRLGMEIIEQLTGERPLGWYTGRDSPNTRRLVADYGGFEYDSDYYGDDLPFWMKVQQDRRQRRAAAGRALHAGLQRHALRAAAGLRAGRAFLPVPARQLRRALCRGRRRSPKMMSIGMHCRLLGRPGRIVALQRFLDHVATARPRLGLPPHRHRAPLEAGPPLSGRLSMALTLEQLNAAAARRSRPAAGRPVRALALDRRGGAGAAAVPLAAAT